MTQDEYFAARKKVKEVYDTIDFTPYLKGCNTLNELREVMGEKYNYTEITKNDFMRGCFFNTMTDGALMKYLEDRYGKCIDFEPIEDYQIWFQEDNKEES